MSDPARGVLAMVAACSIWGVAPLYYALLAHIPPFEVLAHRTFWSLVAFGLVLAVQGRLREILAAFGPASRWRILAASGMISLNWFFFIYAVQIGQTTQSSLGYYIFPLVAVALGAILFGERPGRLQWSAVGLASVAVLVLTLGAGTTPWISLLLAMSFATYGVLKKRLPVGPVVSVTAEVVVVAPIAILILLSLGGGAEGLARPTDLVLLILSGPLTALPLILFSYASRRIGFGTLGLIQYLNPSLQFLCAVLVFGEPFGPVNLVAFGLIWTAVALYSWAGMARSAATSSSTEPTTRT